jgi:hypothetical protein
VLTTDLMHGFGISLSLSLPLSLSHINCLLIPSGLTFTFYLHHLTWLVEVHRTLLGWIHVIQMD